MARSYGVLKTSVWEPQSDFRALQPLEQWAYAMLISQPQISNLGVLPHTPEKWRRFARDLSAPALEEALEVLERERYTIVDVDTGELLVRTFIKHDAVWKVPKLVTNARKLIREVESDGIRGYLIDRHPWLVEPWTKEQIEAHETALDTPSDTRTDRGIDTPIAVPVPEGVRKGVSEGVSPRARARGAGPGAGAGSSSRTSNHESFDLDDARANGVTAQETAAAAARVEAPTETQIDQALATLKATDKGSYARVAPLAQQLPADVFDQVIERVHDRKSTGTVKNDVGLLIDLLRTTIRAVAHAAAAEQAARIDELGPGDELKTTAHGYAINHHPWDIVKPLLERRITRLAETSADRKLLLAIAQDAYNEAADPEPVVTTTAPTATVPAK